MGGDEPRFRVLHVSNISMSATKEQIYQLFAFIGRIDEFKMYPTDNHPQLSTFTQKFAYVKFEESKSVEVAQHLTNTVFIDRALVCIPSISDAVPDEETALKTGGPAWPGQRQLPPNVVNQIQDLGDGQQMVIVIFLPSRVSKMFRSEQQFIISRYILNFKDGTLLRTFT
uniref:Splicing factor, arginine/serine-rich 7 n=1 Tax=Ascaris suum TaxID=6253 RepID=F1LG31_ASCSU